MASHKQVSGVMLRRRAAAFIFVTALGVTDAAVFSGAVADEAPSPPFLFSEDNNISQTQKQVLSTVTPNTALRDDKWLNEPLTRLDYVLIRIQSRLTANLTEEAQDYASKYFERDPEGLAVTSIDFFASYSDEKGRLDIGASVLTHGKPKKPMKQFCAAILSMMEQWYPLQPYGRIAWQDGALVPLMRDNAGQYDDTVWKLAQSALYTVTVSTGYSDKGQNGFWYLGCMRQKADAPVTFWKYSARQ